MMKLIYCYIDRKGKVIVPFQSMTQEQISEFRKISETIASRDKFVDKK
jgi:hypothetical protein